MPQKISFDGTYQAIESIAAKIREIVDSNCGSDDIGEKLKWLIALLGGKVEIADLSDGIAEEGGSLVVRQDKSFAIYLSPYTSPLRDNFTLAHELGHFILHCDLDSAGDDKSVIFTRFGSNREEWQANRFAAAFLMPKDSFTQSYNSFNGDISMLSGHFGVSGSAVSVRASSLNLVK